MRRAGIAVVLAVLLALLTPSMASANYWAHDPREPGQKHLNIESVSSTVFWGPWELTPREKLVRFRVNFYDWVAWRKVLYPNVYFNMDSFGRPGVDYQLDIFLAKLAGDSTRQPQCWLSHFSRYGNVVLMSAKMKIGPRFATCTFPKTAMRLRPSGNVRWQARTRYRSSIPHFDSAPDDPYQLFPHL